MCRPDLAKDSTARSSAALKNCELNKDDEWLAKFDFTSFSEEIRALGKKLEMEQGPADVAHLNKMIMWSNSFAAVGLLSMGFGVNPISVICLSLYTFSRWTMIAHHVCHGGYEKCHPNKSRWSRFKFGLGTLWRRFCDWFDWMMPEAWNVEHNTRYVVVEKVTYHRHENENHNNTTHNFISRSLLVSVTITICPKSLTPI